MKRGVRKVFLQNWNHADILYDERVYRVGAEIDEFTKKVVYILVVKAYVKRAKKFFAGMQQFRPRVQSIEVQEVNDT